MTKVDTKSASAAAKAVVGFNNETTNTQRVISPMKKTALLLVALFAFPFSAMAADVTGAWKSTETDSLTGKLRTVVISEDNISIGENSAAITIEEDKNRYVVRRTGEKDPILVAVLHDANWAQFTNHIFGTKTFVRTTQDEVRNILSAPSQPEQDPLTSKADPF
ncbi:hypothetical protein LJC23_00070 [Desulfovibrio sp. OttesenSCG-928-I05]|nr:hypothetical protein [Desulfovibrio sp. OttesenSCG-928-O18]MDL2271411.1 hypothetical protein [Desulfovibrio sp. OttesenSCG-928-I05]